MSKARRNFGADESVFQSRSPADDSTTSVKGASAVAGSLEEDVARSKT